MAQVCDVCGKGPQFGNNISHAHNVTKRRWNVNLQAVKALVNGNSQAHPRVHQLHQERQGPEGIAFLLTEPACFDSHTDYEEPRLVEAGFLCA